MNLVHNKCNILLCTADILSSNAREVGIKTTTQRSTSLLFNDVCVLSQFLKGHLLHFKFGPGLLLLKNNINANWTLNMLYKLSLLLHC